MSINKKTAQQLILRAGRELVRTGLIARTWGNISARISDTSFLITPSGRSYETLQPEDLVEVRIDDCSYAGPLKPSSEMKVHAVCYQDRPDTDFVIHTHQDYATALSTLGQDLSFPGQALSAIPTAEYAIFGSDSLAANVDHALKRCKSHVVLMRNHGTVCLGRDYEDAFRLAHQLEKECKKEYMKKISPVITDEILHYENGPDENGPETRERAQASLESQPDGLCENEKLWKYTSDFGKHSDGCYLFTKAPYISKYASFGDDLTVYVDDLGMMVGPLVHCLPVNTSEDEICSALTSTLPVISNAVLVQGDGAECYGKDGMVNSTSQRGVIGAVCYGKDRSEAEAMVMVLNKGCQAGLLEKAGLSPKAASLATRIREHEIYVEKYAKLK